MGKRKIGKINRKPIVIGDPNLISKNEININDLSSGEGDGNAEDEIYFFMDFSIYVSGRRTAKRGMTWYEWCQSDYNYSYDSGPNNDGSVGFSCSAEAGYVYPVVDGHTDGFVYDLSSGSIQAGHDVIKEGALYGIPSGGSGQ